MVLLKFYSQFGEDEWIASNLNLPQKGFYVDVGCGHPFNQSNTAFLREMGWEGIAIDGNPAWTDQWNGYLEPCFLNRVISNRNEQVMFDIHAVPEYSRININGSIKCISVTLDQIIGDTMIDFLSIDTEGSEYDVITGLAAYKLPRIIVSEYNTAGIGEDFRVCDYLLKEGYAMVRQTVANQIFTDE